MPHRRFFVVILSLLTAFFIISVSLWRLNLAAVGKEELDYAVPISAATRLQQLVSPPILPDHPLYIIGMVSDRLELMVASPTKRFELRLQYANTRLSTAHALLDRGRLALALSTITKAEKYVIAAAQDVPLLPIEEQDRAAEKLADTISLHKSQLTAMKSSFSDRGKAVIDRLIEQLLILPSGR